MSGNLRGSESAAAAACSTPDQSVDRAHGSEGHSSINSVDESNSRHATAREKLERLWWSASARLFVRSCGRSGEQWPG